jgi:hypothetical protein
MYSILLYFVLFVIRLRLRTAGWRTSFMHHHNHVARSCCTVSLGFNVEDDLMHRSSYAPVIVSAMYAHVFGMWYLQITNVNVHSVLLGSYQPLLDTQDGV